MIEKLNLEVFEETNSRLVIEGDLELLLNIVNGITKEELKPYQESSTFTSESELISPNQRLNTDF